jgi:hypothetical protein
VRQPHKSESETDNSGAKARKHSKVITAFRTLDNTLHWRFETRNVLPGEEESIDVRFFVILKDCPMPMQADAMKVLLRQVDSHQIDWLVPGRKEWAFDLDGMKEQFVELQDVEWCAGRVYVEPEFQVEKEKDAISRTKYYETFIVFCISPGVLGMTAMHVPPEIQQSIRDFRLDHPDPRKVAFLMMKYGKTKAHESIVEGLRQALTAHGIVALRADEKDYHTDLYPNILTYLHGCGFGIAVFERIEQDEFNPNVSLEVGYMIALGKNVCLLKDKTLPKLHTDLVSKLYKEFDPQDPIGSIPPVLERWMRDWHVI